MLTINPQDIVDQFNETRKRNLGDSYYCMLARLRQGEPGSLNQAIADVLDAVVRGDLVPKQ